MRTGVFASQSRQTRPGRSQSRHRCRRPQRQGRRRACDRESQRFQPDAMQHERWQIYCIGTDIENRTGRPFMTSVMPAAADVRVPALRLDGRVLRPLRLDAGALQGLVQHTVVRRALSCAARSLDPAVGLRCWQGVRLTALLELAGLQLDRQRERGGVCVHAHGRDGYVASFSWSELFNGPAGGDVLV
ncbi:MAG: hypothetical protein EKK65_11035, partial [Lysobacterales bacterium]